MTLKCLKPGHYLQLGYILCNHTKCVFTNVSTLPHSSDCMWRS